MVATKEKEDYKFRRNISLTGIRDLKDTRQGKTAVIWCSGPTFSKYDDGKIPEDWSRFSINETIKCDWDGWHGRRPDYWVLSDLPVVQKFSMHCPTDSTILAMHRATETITKVCPRNKIYTVNSMGEKDGVKDYGNGYEFFSRRTVMIGAVEMARYMGFNRFFVFGLDLFRLPSRYYYDGKDAIYMGERRSPQQFMIRTPPGAKHEGQRIYQTPNLRAARKMLDQVKKADLWSDIEIHVVGSPYSHQDVVPKMSYDEFNRILGEEKPKPIRTDDDPVPVASKEPDKARKLE